MLSFLFVLAFGQFKLVGEVALETTDDFYEYIEEYGVQSDDPVLLCGKFTAFQFDKDGHLLRKIGTSGKGPGQFQTIFGAYSVDGKIIIQDDDRGDVSFFDKAGAFVAKCSPRYKNFFILKSQRLTISSESMHHSQGALYPFELQDNFTIVQSGPNVHPMRPEVEKYNFNFANLTVCESDKFIYVMDEIVPEVSVYSFDLKPVMRFMMSLPKFVPLEEK